MSHSSAQHNSHANIHHPSMLVSDAVLRRRSADVGGLHLAMRGESQGQGWLDSTGSVSIIETKYAELLTTMYRETCRLVESNAALSDPPELSAGDRERLLKSLDAWYFEPLQMPEDEVLACVLFFFQVLFRIEGMKDAVKIDMNVIPRFVLHIRQLYRWQNHYHNFEHAVDVLQAIHCYLRAAGMVPPVSLLLTDADAPGGVGMWKSTREPDSGPLVTCLTPHEIFALYLAAIGHDVAHPGLSNLFMQNAETPLSQVYDNQSALEQMHSYLLLTTMRHHGMGVLLDDPQTGTLFRKILKGSVLATDMGVHQAFMDEFAKVLDGTSETSDGIMQWRSTKCFRQIFVCQVLLKNADISNPCRPFLVSKQWASALQQEWSCQYKFENFLQLQHSVNPSNGLLAEANSQVYFTRNIAKPLVDLTTIAIPELRQYSYHCAENLREWEQILKELQAPTPSTTAEHTEPTSTSVPASTSTPATNPSSSTPSSTPSSVSPTRQNSTVPATSATTIIPSTQFASSPSPTPISTSTSVSTSSSNPVSPRILHPSENDYSTAFRLALPRTRSDGSNLSPGVSVTPGSGGSSITGGVLSGGKRQMSSGGGTGGGSTSGNTGGSGTTTSCALSPSLSRTATRAAVGALVQPNRTYSNSSAASASSASEDSPSSEVRRYPHPISHSLAQSHVEDRSDLDGYRFPLVNSSSGNVPPAPPPTADLTASPSFPGVRAHHSNTPSAATSLCPSDSTRSQSQACDASSSSVVDVGDGGSSVSENRTSFSGLGEDLEVGVGKGEEEDEYEADAQAHRANFYHALGLGLGVGSLKKKKSSGVVGGGSLSSGGYFSPHAQHQHQPQQHQPQVQYMYPGPLPNFPKHAQPQPQPQPQQQKSQGENQNQNQNSSQNQNRDQSSLIGRHYQHQPNRASWCSGEPVPIDVDREVRTVEDAKGAIGRWTRGRWGASALGAGVSAGSNGDSSGSGSGGSGSGSDGEVRSRAVAVEESDSESGDDGRRVLVRGVERDSVPAGLVSAAPQDSDSDVADLDVGPQTPPQQTGVLDTGNDELNRSGSPTPKAKIRPIVGTKTRRETLTEKERERQREKEREREERRRKRAEEELGREEEKREKLRRELIRQEEEEKEKMRREFEFLNQESGGSSGSGGKRSARSRSRSKARRKGKGKK